MADGHPTDDTTTRDVVAPDGVTVPEPVYLPDAGVVDVPDEVENPAAVTGTDLTPVADDRTTEIAVVLDGLLDDIYAGQERITQAEIHRRAVAAELPADVLIRITALPEGEYAIDEAAELLGAREAR